MSQANPLWGSPRIHGELLKLGIDVSQATVSKYMVKPEHRPSQSWQTFLTNHAWDMVSIDFFTVLNHPPPNGPVSKSQRLSLGILHRDISSGIAFDEQHLKRVLREYVGYYHRSRTHLGLEKDCPDTRAVEPSSMGPVQSEPVLGGLHHRYTRRAA